MNFFLVILAVLIAYILYEIMSRVFVLVETIKDLAKLHQLQLDEQRKQTELLRDEWHEMYGGPPES